MVNGRSQSASSVSGINLLVFLSDIYGKDARERCYAFLLFRIPHRTGHRALILANKYCVYFVCLFTINIVFGSTKEMLESCRV
jgi:hypothetical protein